MKYLMVCLVILWLLSIPFLFFAQRWVIFKPEKLKKDYVFHFDSPFEEKYFAVSGGDSLHSIFIKSPKQPSKGVIFYLHGNADNLQRWAQYHKDFTSKGYDFFAMEYRGYGKSTGIPDELTMYEDARTCYDFLHESYNAPQIVIYGRSLGTGVAAQLATQVPSKCLILETPYNNINCALAKHILLNHLPFELAIKLQTEAHIPKISCPIYAFHGTNDMVVSYACAKKIKPLLGSKDKFITIEGGGHKDLSQFALFQEELTRILE